MVAKVETMNGTGTRHVPAGDGAHAAYTGTDVRRLARRLAVRVLIDVLLVLACAWTAWELGRCADAMYLEERTQALNRKGN